MSTNVQRVLAVTLSGVTLLVAGMAVSAAATDNSHDFAGVVNAAAVLPLDMQTAGPISQILVRPGDAVKAGQVLALQDSTVADAVISADKAVVQADTMKVLELASPPMSSALAHQQAIQEKSRTQSQSAVTIANAALSQAQSSAASAKQVVAQSATLLAFDQRKYLMCVPSTCDEFNRRVIQDQANFDRDARASDQAQALVQISSDRLTQATANAGLTEQLAATLPATGSLLGTPADLALARAQSARDSARLLQDEATQAQGSVLAPVDGIILDVNGVVGDVDSPDGIRQIASSSQGGSTSTNGGNFSLLPAAQNGLSASQPSHVPLFTLETYSPQQVVIQVPEAQVNSIVPSVPTYASIPAAGVSSQAVHLLRVSSSGVPTSDGVMYRVTFEFSQDVPTTVRNGMTADITIG